MRDTSEPPKLIREGLKTWILVGLEGPKYLTFAVPISFSTYLGLRLKGLERVTHQTKEA